MKHWEREFAKCVAINLWAPEWDPQSLTKLDIEALASACSEAGADVVYLWQGWSHDHFGLWYYPNAWGKEHPRLGGRDHMREIINALHSRGLTVIGYHSYADREIWLHEKDWRCVNEDGHADEKINFGALCPNSPYHEYVVSRQTETLRRYPEMDGICLLDGGSFPKNADACYCQYCQKKYWARFGRYIPHFTGEQTPEWSTYLRWKEQCVTELFDDLKQRCRDVRSDIAISHLSFGGLSDREGVGGTDFERLTQGDDFSNAIASWSDASWSFVASGSEKIRRDPSAIWRCGYTARFLRAISPNRAHVHIGRFTYDREYQVAPLHEMFVAAASVIAAGGCPSLADNLYPDGSFSRTAFDNARKIFDWVDQIKPFIPEGDELADVALLYDKATANLRAIEVDNRYTRGFQAAYMFLKQEHIPFRVIARRQMTLEQLQSFKVVLLNEVAAISDEDASLLRKYVEQGGKLLCVGDIGIADEKGTPRALLALADVQGVCYINHFCQPICYIAKDKNATLDELIVCRGRVMKLHPDSDSVVRAVLVEGASVQFERNRSVTYANDMQAGAFTRHPMVLTHSYGHGTAATIAFDAITQWGVYGYESMRVIIHDTLTELLGDDRRVTILARSTVETSIYPCKNGLRIHCVNGTVASSGMVLATGGTMAVEAISSGDIMVRVRTGASLPRVTLLPQGITLPVQNDNNDIFFTIPPFDVYACVEIIENNIEIGIKL